MWVDIFFCFSFNFPGMGRYQRYYQLRSMFWEPSVVNQCYLLWSYTRISIFSSMKNCLAPNPQSWWPKTFVQFIYIRMWLCQLMANHYWYPLEVCQWYLVSCCGGLANLISMKIIWYCSGLHSHDLWLWNLCLVFMFWLVMS